MRPDLGCPLGFSRRRDILRWTKQATSTLGIRPREHLGQNFLIDPRGIGMFVESVAEYRGLDLIEVGCGLGILTVNIAEKAGRIVCIEVDAGLAAASSHVAWLCGLDDKIQVVRGDGLDHVRATGISTLYSNPPFNIASQLLVEAVKNNSIRSLVISLQSDVARKLLAEPGERDYGRITVITRFFFNVEWRGLIPKSWFWPTPKVDAAILFLSRVRAWDSRGGVLEELLRCMFSYKNKLAYRIASGCLETLGCRGASLEWLGLKRVRNLTISDIDAILGVAVECISRRSMKSTA